MAGARTVSPITKATPHNLRPTITAFPPIFPHHVRKNRTRRQAAARHPPESTLLVRSNPSSNNWPHHNKNRPLNQAKSAFMTEHIAVASIGKRIPAEWPSREHCRGKGRFCRTSSGRLARGPTRWYSLLELEGSPTLPGRDVFRVGSAETGLCYERYS